MALTGVADVTTPDPRQTEARPTVVHITTVPLSLRTFLTGQARHMNENGFSIHGVSSSGVDLERFRRSEGVPVHVVEMTRRVSPMRDMVALVRLWFTIREIGPTIVHAHTPKGGLLGMLAASLAGVPVRIYHIRGMPHATASGLRRLFLLLAERVSCGLAHRVLAVSRSMRDIAVHDRLCRPDKIRVLLGGSGNGVDVDGRFRPPDATASATVKAELGIPVEARVIGFVGRLGREKGVRELAAAWEKLREDYQDLYLLLVGEHEIEDPLPGWLLDWLRVDPRVRITGWVPDASRYYGAMDVVALPSYREGMPNVALEAAATERPIVAARVPGCADAVVDGSTGTLVEVRDARALCEGLRRYLLEPALRARHGAAARRRVLEEFRQERIWGATADEYRALLALRAPARPVQSAQPVMTSRG